jgi:hypothetical protein
VGFSEHDSEFSDSIECGVFLKQLETYLASQKEDCFIGYFVKKLRSKHPTARVRVGPSSSALSLSMTAWDCT